MVQITTNFLPFSYVDVFLGTIKETNEIVTIEEYAAGDFVKYVNNTGKTHANKNDDQYTKAESLVHFSYVKSNKKLLLVDIQGANYTLTEPEIATLCGVFSFVLETFQRKHTPIFSIHINAVCFATCLDYCQRMWRTVHKITLIK